MKRRGVGVERSYMKKEMNSEYHVIAYADHVSLAWSRTMYLAT